MTDAEVKEPEAKEPDPPKESLIDAVKEVLSELGITGGSTPAGDSEPEPEADGDSPELASPRKIELDTERSITDAVKGLTINVHTGDKKPAEKKEPEQAPGGKSWLTKFIGMGD